MYQKIFVNSSPTKLHPGIANHAPDYGWNSPLLWIRIDLYFHMYEYCKLYNFVLTITIPSHRYRCLPWAPIALAGLLGSTMVSDAAWVTQRTTAAVMNGAPMTPVTQGCVRLLFTINTYTPKWYICVPRNVFLQDVGPRNSGLSDGL
jgi:hypothetical protein